MSCCVRTGPHRRGGGSSMIEMRRAQLSFGDGLIAEEVSDLREDWMKHADAVLADQDIVAAVYEALARRHAKSRSRGRRGAPAEVVLRLLIHGLNRCRYKGDAGMKRWVGLGMIADNIINIGRAMEKRAAPSAPAPQPISSQITAAASP